MKKYLKQYADSSANAMEPETIQKNGASPKSHLDEAPGSARVMETETIQKNGASPKSLMSRGIF
jgi:hypothetical protein